MLLYDEKLESRKLAAKCCTLTIETCGSEHHTNPCRSRWMSIEKTFNDNDATTFISAACSQVETEEVNAQTSSNIEKKACNATYVRELGKTHTHPHRQRKSEQSNTANCPIWQSKRVVTTAKHKNYRHSNEVE